MQLVKKYVIATVSDEWSVVCEHEGGFIRDRQVKRANVTPIM